MKNIALIDGENFVHSIVASLKKTKCIQDRRELKKIDLSILFSELPIAPNQARYYMTRIQMPESDHQLFQVANQMRNWNKHWLPYLANQGVELVRAGMLKIRDGKRCKSCGKSTEILLEKGVDVRIAVDILQSEGDIYLFSSDSDLIPAVLAVKKSSKKIIYVCVEGQKNRAMQNVATKTLTISDKKIKEAFNSTHKKGKK